MKSLIIITIVWLAIFASAYYFELSTWTLLYGYVIGLLNGAIIVIVDSDNV